MELDEARLRSGLRQLLPAFPDDGALERVIRKGKAGRRRRNVETAAAVVFVVAAVVFMVVGVLHAVGNLPPVPPVVTTVPVPPPVPDAGSWQRLPVSVSVDGGGLGHTPVVSLVMDPSDPSILYAATALGLFKSNDGAQTWSQLPTIEGEVFLVGVDPASPSTVYAVQPPLVDAPPYLNRLMRSDDGGISWTDLSDADTPRFICAMITMMWFDTTFSPSAICTATDDWNAVLRSTDRGETWTKVSTDQGNEPDTHSPNLPAAVQAQYDLEMRLSGGFMIDADTGAVIRVGRALVSTMSGYVRSVVVDPDNLSTSYVRMEMGVYKSIDGGGTWRKASAGVPSDQTVITLVIDPSTPSTLYATLGSGIVKSTDGGANWSVILDGTSCFLLAPSNPSRLYAGTYEGLFRSDDGGGSWTRLAGTGLPTFVPVLVAADQPDTLFAFSQPDGHLYRSTDAGNSWTQALQGLSDYGFECAEADPQHPSTIYLSANTTIYNAETGENDITGHVLKSTDAGATWTELAPQEWGAPVVSLAVDPRDPAIVWAVQGGGSASDTSVFHRSTDGGNTWEVVELAGLGPGTDRLLFDPHLPDTLYALSEPPHGDWAVLRSTDAGRTWEDIAESIRAAGPVFFVPDPAPGGALYAATSRGVFKWVPESK